MGPFRPRGKYIGKIPTKHFPVLKSTKSHIGDVTSMKKTPLFKPQGGEMRHMKNTF